MSYSNRIWLYGPVGLVFLGAVLWSVFWRVEADMLSAKLDRANGGEIVPGIMFTFAEKSIGGFPFRYDVVLSGVTVSHQGPDGETAWRSEKVAIHALTYGQALYLLEAAGLQSFAVPGGTGQGPRVTYLTPGLARASAVLRQGKLERFDLDLMQSEGKDATPGADITRTFSAARAQLHLLNRPDSTVDVVMRIDDAHIGDGYNPALGSALALVDLRGKLVQGAELDALKTGIKSVPDAAEDWRQAGGTLSVEKLELDWGGIKTELKGAIGLDAEHRPDGALIGNVDAGAFLSKMTGGKLSFNTASESALPFSISFKNGEMKIGGVSALPGTR